MDGGGLDALLGKSGNHLVALVLLLHEQHRTVVALLELIDEEVELVLSGDVGERLSHEFRSRADDADGEVHEVRGEEVTRHLLDRGGEGGGKHERLAVQRGNLDLGGLGLSDEGGGASAVLGHVELENDLADLGLETHVEHAVSLVNDQVLDLGQSDEVLVIVLDQTAGGRDEDIRLCSYRDKRREYRPDM